LVPRAQAHHQHFIAQRQQARRLQSNDGDPGSANPASASTILAFLPGPPCRWSKRGRVNSASLSATVWLPRERCSPPPNTAKARHSRCRPEAVVEGVDKQHLALGGSQHPQRGRAGRVLKTWRAATVAGAFGRQIQQLFRHGARPGILSRRFSSGRSGWPMGRSRQEGDQF
jgi:hypothetical protein